MGKVFGCRGCIMAVLMLCIVVPELFAQIPRRPLARNFPARLSPRSRQVSRSFVPVRGSRLLSQPRVSSTWSGVRPRLSEVSVPTVQRSSLTTRGVTRTAVTQRRRVNDFRAFQRDVNPTRTTRRLRRLPPFPRRRFSTAPRSLQVGHILPRLSRRNNHNNINNNNNNNDDDVDINYYTSNVNLHRGGPPPVRVRSLSRISDTARRPVVVRTRPLHPLPAVTVRSGPRHDAPKVFSRRRLRGLSSGLRQPIQDRTNSVVVQQRVSTQGGARLPAVEQSRRNVAPVVHVTRTGTNTKPLNPSSPKILSVSSVKIETPPSTKLDTTPTKQIEIIPSTEIETVRLKTKEVLPSPNDVRVPLPGSGNAPILTNLNDARTQPKPSVDVSQTQKTPTVDPFQRDLVDVFTQVLEGYLAPQGTLEQPVSPAAVPIASPATIQQPISQSGGPYSQYNPYNPYNNPYGQMTSFGYMNPWMSPAMMQEMWYGDTQDPPDGVTTTSAPANTTAINSTTDGALTNEALGADVVDPVAGVIKSKGAVETTTETTVPVEIVTDSSIVEVRTTQEPSIIVTADTTVSDVLKATEATPSVADANKQVKVIVKTDSTTNAISENKQDGVSSALDTGTKKLPSVPDSNHQSVESNPDITTNGQNKQLKGSEQLLVDIATLIRKSKVDIAHFSKMISDHTAHSHSSHGKGKAVVSQRSRLSQERSEPIVGQNTQVSNDPSKLVVEALPTAEQLGIVLPEYIVPATPVTKQPEIPVTKRPVISNSKRPEIPVTKHQELLVTKRPMISVTTRPVIQVTKRLEIPVTIPPRSVPTPPSLPIIPPSTPSSSIPKGLVFTRQPDMFRTLSTILMHNPDAVKKAFTTDPTPPISSLTNDSHSSAQWQRETNGAQSTAKNVANEVVLAPEDVLVDKTTDVLSAVMDNDENTSGLDKAADPVANITINRKDTRINKLSASLETKSTKETMTNVSDQSNATSSSLGKDRSVTKIVSGVELPPSIRVDGSTLATPILVNGSTLIPPNKANGSMLIPPNKVNGSTLIPPILAHRSTLIPSNKVIGSTLAPTSLGPSDIPVLANVVVESVMTEGIEEKVTDNVNITSSSDQTNHSLREQLQNITAESGNSGGVDLSNYLSDPSFLNILRQALLKLTQPQANTTADTSSTRSETTTSIPEILSTTSVTLTTTEEYELEDYLPEGTTTFESPTTSEPTTMTSTMTSH